MKKVYEKIRQRYKTHWLAADLAYVVIVFELIVLTLLAISLF